VRGIRHAAPLDALSLGDTSGGNEKKVKDDAERTPDEEKHPVNGQYRRIHFAGAQQKAAYPFRMDETVSAANEHSAGENGTDGIAMQGAQGPLLLGIRYPDTIEG
jgi:hypothetical protein